MAINTIEPISSTDQGTVRVSKILIQLKSRELL